MNVLVTGAAGYIGSIVTEQLIKERNTVYALDNLQQGHREAVDRKARFIRCDLADVKQIDRIWAQYPQIEAVIHLAAETSVGHSMSDPGRYFESNVVYSLQLLNTMLKHGVRKFVFSSSAALYGSPAKVPIKESAATLPVNPYGESKLMFERILHWHAQVYQLKYISLRYFNVAGASERFGEDHSPETHLIPNILKVALGQAEHLPLFGNDYPTHDGTCVRDYCHVLDIAGAHVLALNRLATGTCNRAYNLGNNRGYSVLDVVKAAEKVTGLSIPIIIHPERKGDPPVLVADSGLAKAKLGWRPDHPDIESIIDSAWQWHRRHPHGYKRGPASAKPSE